MRVAGIDCSTTVCGWAVYCTDTKELMAYGHHVFTKGTEIADKLFEFVSHIVPELTKHLPDKIVLEDFLKQFNGGATSSQAMMGLAQMNGAVDFILRDRFGSQKVIKMHPSTARKNALGVGVITPKEAHKLGFIDSKGKVDTKRWILESVDNRFENFNITDYTPRSKKPQFYYYDIADAVVLSMSLK